MSKKKILLTSVFKPYGVKDDYAEMRGMKMELLDNQITQMQGIHSPRQSYWSFCLYLLAENISIPSVVLDFPTWKEFTKELKRGYTHVGISFIVPNILKAKRMVKYVRKNHPEIKIILGGYGTIIPNLREIVPYDEICIGEGVSWLRKYFGDDPEAPLKHPVIYGPAFERIYGHKTKPKGSILLPGVGCENACDFCVTSHKFGNKYISLFSTGKEVFEACLNIESEIGSKGFSIMDENFLKKTSRVIELLEEMTKHNKSYVFDIFSSAEVVRNLGVDFLNRLGIRMIWIGVESERYVHKKVSGIDMKTLFEELQSKGIIVIASAILFLDHHDKDSIQKDIDYVIGLGSNLIQFMNYTPYPTTSLYKRLEKEGRLKKNVHFRHHHGQGELLFKHPHFENPKDHVKLLRNAFLKNYKMQGPGILNMALTAIRGYKKVKEEFVYRQNNGISWNPETLNYEKCDSFKPDEFMKLRIRKMQRIAMILRPIVFVTKIFAPNRTARKKAKETQKLYNEIFGKPKFKDRIRSFFLMLSGTIEAIKILWSKITGKDGITYQPPSRRVEYSGNELLKKTFIQESIEESVVLYNK